MDPAFERSDVRVYLGDCREVMRTFADASVDAIVTDPPYELGSMGKRWDATGIAYDIDVWRECLRVLKPGGHLVAFGGTRTYHRMTCAIEDAGFEVRDCLAWMYSSGFPKSKNVSLAIDKSEGMPNRGRAIPTASRFQNGTDQHLTSNPVDEYAAKTDAARQWQGWGTALKPAFEPAVLARKPLISTVAANVLAHGTGGLNIDGTRIAHANADDLAKHKAMVDAVKSRGGSMGNSWKNSSDLANANEVNSAGRWPANVLLDEEAALMLDNVTGEAPARFFYTAKASRSEREEGLREEGLREEVCSSFRGGGDNPVSALFTKTARNTHPTVKPLDLMRYLCRLVTPPGGIVLDPFAGSGSTLIAAYQEGFAAIGIEREEQYLEIIRGRVNGATKQQRLF